MADTRTHSPAHPGSRALQEARLEPSSLARHTWWQVFGAAGCGTRRFRKGGVPVLARLMLGNLGFRVPLQPAAPRDSA